MLPLNNDRGKRFKSGNLKFPLLFTTKLAKNLLYTTPLSIYKLQKNINSINHLKE